MIIIICNFISCIWQNRTVPNKIEERVIVKILKEKDFLFLLLKAKVTDVFSKKYCELDFKKLKNFKDRDR